MKLPAVCMYSYKALSEKYQASQCSALHSLSISPEEKEST